MYRRFLFCRGSRPEWFIFCKTTDKGEFYSVELSATGSSAEVPGTGDLYPADIPVTRVSV
jgi:hypothetical protein